MKCFPKLVESSCSLHHCSKIKQIKEIIVGIQEIVQNLTTGNRELKKILENMSFQNDLHLTEEKFTISRQLQTRENVLLQSQIADVSNEIRKYPDLQILIKPQETIFCLISFA